MNSLSIHTQRASIEITSRPAKVTIQNNWARFDMTHELPSMRIDSVLPQFTVSDEYLAISKPSAGEDVSSVGNEKAKAADLGNSPQANNMGNGTVPVSDAAVSVKVKDSPEFNIGLKPREKARLEWEPGYCTIEWTDPFLQIEWDSDFMPSIEWEPYAVEVRLRNRPLVLIRVNLENIPGNVGVRVDQRI